MLRNHSSAVVIINWLGLNYQKSSSHVQFKGGLKLTLQGMLDHLGWTMRTFTWKSSTYSTCRRLATYSWSGPLPTAASPAYQLYIFWQGLVGMFAVGEFTDWLTAPSRSGLLGQS